LKDKEIDDTVYVVGLGKYGDMELKLRARR